MRAPYARQPFEQRWYPLWCGAWLGAQRHLVHLAELIQNHPSPDLDAILSDTATPLDEALAAGLERLDTGQADDALLLRVYAALRRLESYHRAEFRRHWSAPPIVERDRGRHLLIPPLKHSTRPDDPGRTFALADELAIPGVLGLGYRWLPLQADDQVVWARFADLDVAAAKRSLAIGLAPIASKEEMQWAITSTEPRGLDGRVPLRCIRALDAAALRARIDAALLAAYAAGVQLLLMPELVVDEAALAACRDWLKANNRREPRLRLVVAGSRHCDCGALFANRCTVLDYAGNVLWEQDKRSPFKLEHRPTLQRLSPDRPVPLGFEPTMLGRRLVIAETAVGRILSPICLDFIEGALWADLGADLYLVPAMTGNLGRFRRRAEDLGGLHGAATLVCNARLDKERCHAYRPATLALEPMPAAAGELFTTEIDLTV